MISTPFLANTWPDLQAGSAVPLNLGMEFSAAAQQATGATLILSQLSGRSRIRSYRALSFPACAALMEQYALSFASDGIKRSDPVLVLMKPSLQFPPIFLALWRIGAVPIAVDPGAARAQKLACIAQAAPQTLIGPPLAHAIRLRYPRALRTITRSIVIDNGQLAATPATGSLVRQSDREQSPFLSSDTAAIVFTSGSTGMPKGVVYTAANAAAVVASMKEALHVGPDDVCLSCHPMFVLYFMGMGSSVIIPDLDPRYPAQADPAGLLDIIQTHRPTVAFMQLSILTNLVKYCARRGVKLPGLQKILTTGAPLPIDLIQSLHRVLAEPDGDVYSMYGATEALSICYAAGRDILLHVEAIRSGRGIYLGLAAAGARYAVMDITDDPLDVWQERLALPPGEIGEICVSGPMVTSTYLHQPAMTRRAKVNDQGRVWHRTGDAGFVDASGALWYLGRLSNRVQTRRRIVYAEAVEPFFNGHLGDRKCALVGVPTLQPAVQRPVLLIESGDDCADRNQTARQAVAQEVMQLAKGYPGGLDLRDLLFYEDKFPVDVRHNAKILRESLANYAGRIIKREDISLESMGTILFHGHKVAYYEQGMGQPLLFLHNAGNDHHIWDGQLAHFAQTHRVIAIDSLGYGASDSPPLDYTLTLYTDMVGAIIDALELPTPTIIGNCTGATMALSYGLRCPQRIQQLILFNVATPHTARGGNLALNSRLLSGRPRLARRLSPWVERLMRYRAVTALIARSQHGKPRQADPVFLDYLRQLYTRPGKMSCFVNLLSHWDSLAPLDEVTLPAGFPPVHVVWGAANRVLPARQGRAFVKRLRPQTADFIAEGGHLVMREMPDKVNALLEKWLTPAKQ